jgi:hypothetical protein
LLFALLGPRGTIVPVHMTGGGVVVALAVRASDGSLRIGLINKDLARGVRVLMDVGRDLSGASILRLTGPGPQATSDVTLGGAQVDTTGEWSPRAERVVLVVDRAITLDLPAMSAALVTLNIQ